MKTTLHPASVRPLVIAMLGVLLAVAPAGGETVTVGGATVTVPQGWKRATVDGRVVLTPPDLPEGVVCTLTLLGGEAFEGSVKDRLSEDFKPFESAGKVVADDGGTLTGAGTSVEIAGRAATIDVDDGKASLNVWLVIAHANGRIEKMIFVATTAEAYDEHVPAVMKAVEGTQFAGTAPPAVPVVAGAAGAAGRFGQMKYAVPPGWHEKRYADAIVLSPDAPPRGEELDVTVMPPKAFTGGLAAALALSWDEALAKRGLTKTRTVYAQPYDVRSERKSYKGWQYIRANGVGIAGDGANHYLDMVVIQVNGRLERIVMRGKQYNYQLDRYSLCNHPAYQAAFDKFVFGVTFDDWKEPRAGPASLKGDGVIGAWSGISLFGGQLKAGYAIFFSNGQVYFASKFPVHGCDALDTWLAAELVPGHWGTYTFDGENGLVRMPGTQIPIRSDPNGLVLTTYKTEHKYIRLPTVDGATFNGTYTTPGPNDTVASISFSADGGFEDRGAIDRMNEQLSYPFRTTEGPGSGTYAVKDHTVLFQYTDGRTFRLAFAGAGYDRENPSPATLEMGFTEKVLMKQ